MNTQQFRTKNFKGVISLLAGNSIAKIIMSVGGLVLANFYGPESYGVYNVFLSYVMILPVLASFRLENIMILQKGSTEIRNLFSWVIWISLAATALLIGILCILKSLGLLRIDLTVFILLLCGAGAVLTAWNSTQNALFTKFQLFKQMSVAFVVASVFSVASQALFYWLKLENGLIYGWLVGLAASFIYNARVSKNRLVKPDFTLFKQSLKAHFPVVKYTYPSDSINALANNILPILVIIYFTKTEVGLYAMAFKVLSTPLVLLSGSVSRVYFQKAVTLYDHDKKALHKLTQRVVYSNVGLILLFILFMNSIGVYLLDLFLKNSWEGLSRYILLLSFWILARSALTPIISILMVIKKNHYSLVFNIYLLLVNFIAIYFGVVQGDFAKCVLVFSLLSGMGYWVVTVLVFLHLNRIKKKNEA